jgi:hypothetical protein
MVLDMESKSDVAYLFLKFAKQPQLAHVACGEGANLNLLMSYPPLSDCTYGKLRQHFPNYVRHPLILESHDQLRLQ